MTDRPSTLNRLIVRFNSDGTISRRSRAETWLGALADAAAPERGVAPTLPQGGVSQHAWVRTGRALKDAMNKHRA
jgi:hypothetical protein